MDFFVALFYVGQSTEHSGPIRPNCSHIHTPITLWGVPFWDTSNYRSAEDSATQNFFLKNVSSSNSALGTVITKQQSKPPAINFSQRSFQPAIGQTFPPLADPTVKPSLYYLCESLQYLFHYSFFFTEVERGLLQEIKTIFTFPLLVQHIIHFWGSFRAFIRADTHNISSCRMARQARRRRGAAGMLLWEPETPSRCFVFSSPSKSPSETRSTGSSPQASQKWCLKEKGNISRPFLWLGLFSGVCVPVNHLIYEG